MGLDVTPWSGVELVRLAEGGHRNEVWVGHRSGDPVAVRQSKRSPSSLSWELELLVWLSNEGFWVPTPIATDAGELSSHGVVVQRWLEGREPSSEFDWRSVAAELQRVHRVGVHLTQRPGCVTVLEATPTSVSGDADFSALPRDVVEVVLSAFASAANAATSLIHGDPGAANIRIDENGRVGLLDWDESRVDVVWHDLSNLGVQVLSDEHHAQALQVSDAWEAVNAWVVEPSYARARLASLTDALSADRSST
jgi:Ser/Thr protein kinase RdoA (MazF antagonist)